MTFEPCTPTIIIYNGDCSSVDRVTLGHLGNWTPVEILNVV